MDQWPGWMSDRLRERLAAANLLMFFDEAVRRGDGGGMAELLAKAGIQMNSYEVLDFDWHATRSQGTG